MFSSVSSNQRFGPLTFAYAKSDKLENQLDWLLENHPDVGAISKHSNQRWLRALWLRNRQLQI
jgi:hypothetical protein